MDFEECNFRRHTTMAIPTYPTALYNLIVRTRSSNFPRVMGILALAIRQNDRGRNRKTAFFSISGSFNEQRNLILKH